MYIYYIAHCKMGISNTRTHSEQAREKESKKGKTDRKRQRTSARAHECGRLLVIALSEGDRAITNSRARENERDRGKQ